MSLALQDVAPPVLLYVCRTTMRLRLYSTLSVQKESHDFDPAKSMGAVLCSTCTPRYVSAMGCGVESGFWVLATNFVRVAYCVAHGSLMRTQLACQTPVDAL